MTDIMTDAATMTGTDATGAIVTDAVMAGATTGMVRAAIGIVRVRIVRIVIAMAGQMACAATAIATGMATGATGTGRAMDGPIQTSTNARDATDPVETAVTGAVIVRLRIDRSARLAQGIVVLATAAAVMAGDATGDAGMVV
jgi:hypothetical protein